MPLFSIIIPTKNRTDYLQRAVKSILVQTIQDFEIIVIDDGSEIANLQKYKDDIQSYKLNNKNIIFLTNKTSQGPAYARNQGLKLSSGEFISFLDDDDEYLPEFLEKSLKALKDTPINIGFCWTSVNHINTHSKLKKNIITKIFQHSTNRNNFLTLSRIGIGHGFTFKKECITQLKGFDCFFKVIEDTEFFFRLIDNKFLPVVISEPLINIYHHDLPRLTNIAMHLNRIIECRILLGKYRQVFNTYKMIEISFLRHFNRLKKQYFKMYQQNIIS